MMNDCNNCGKKSSCDPCGGCKPACYKPYFNLQADPLNPDYWLWEMDGESGRVKLPRLNETDTTLSTNYSNSTLNYKAERHNDTITGDQLGSIINLDDLRDVDATNPDACSILVFNPGCGECPCSPDEERWKKYHIPEATAEAVAKNEFYHVLERTDCGCIRETKIPEMPDWKCIVNNLINAIKPFEGDGRMIDVQGGGSTPQFYGGLDPHTGEFFIHWSDWWARNLLDTSLLKNDVRDTLGGVLCNRVGQGVLSGKLTASNTFNAETGKMTYNISQIYYRNTTYTRDYIGVISLPMTHYAWGCFPGTHDLAASHETLNNEGLALYGGHMFWGPGQSTSDENLVINKTFTGSYSVELNAGGGESNWINVIRLYNDWGDYDDDGLVQLRYRNPLNWTQC